MENRLLRDLLLSDHRPHRSQQHQLFKKKYSLFSRQYCKQYQTKSQSEEYSRPTSRRLTKPSGFPSGIWNTNQSSNARKLPDRHCTTPIRRCLRSSFCLSISIQSVVRVTCLHPTPKKDMESTPAQSKPLVNEWFAQTLSGVSTC